MSSRFNITVISLFAVILVSMVVNLSMGSVAIPVTEVLACAFGTCKTDIQEVLIWQIRLPRLFLAFLVGAGLAWSGAILQTCTRNPLADPYLFGVVSGAGLGVTIAQLLVPASLFLFFPLFAFLGALFAIVVVLFLMRYLVEDEHVVLIGVAVAFFFGAVTQLCLYVGEPLASNRIIFWLLGSFSTAGMEEVVLIFLVLVVASLASLLSARQLDVLLLDNESAQALGVNVTRVRQFYFVACALVTAFIVAYCGGIGFVGLMVPHIVRLWVGASAREVIVGSLLLGGIFMLWVDMIARNILPGQEIPLGVITGLLGSVFFMFLLFNRSARG